MVPPQSVSVFFILFPYFSPNEKILFFNFSNVTHTATEFVYLNISPWCAVLLAKEIIIIMQFVSPFYKMTSRNSVISMLIVWIKGLNGICHT